jgi:hypothetical protein
MESLHIWRLPRNPAKAEAYLRSEHVALVVDTRLHPVLNLDKWTLETICHRCGVQYIYEWRLGIPDTHADWLTTPEGQEWYRDEIVTDKRVSDVLRIIADHLRVGHVVCLIASNTAETIRRLLTMEVQS